MWTLLSAVLNFTVRGLGLSKNSSNIELNLEVNDQCDCADLKDWFDDLWESEEVEDVKEQVLQDPRRCV